MQGLVLTGNTANVLSPQDFFLIAPPVQHPSSRRLPNLPGKQFADNDDGFRLTVRQLTMAETQARADIGTEAFRSLAELANVRLTKPFVAMLHQAIASSGRGGGVKEAPRSTPPQANVGKGGAVKAAASGAISRQQPGEHRTWDDETYTVFAGTSQKQLEDRRRQYSPYNTHWMPHELLRPLHDGWKHFYYKWKDPTTVASSLLSSYFCNILIDDNLPDEDAARFSRSIIVECVEVTNDGEEDAADAMPYHTFLGLIQSLAVVLDPERHPFNAVYSLARQMDELNHRAF